VILDWNPYCFAAGEHGLECFDGTPLFERGGGEEDCRFFDLEKQEVLDFLTANALFWAKQYHADGLSVADAPANRSGADEFLKKLKARMRAKTPDVMLLWGGESNVRATLMGSEFGDPWERGCQRSLSWQLLDQHMHAERQLLTARENHSFLSHAADACKKAIKTETNQD
jgi:1,4-alpha-glucan branching enzyme